MKDFVLNLLLRALLTGLGTAAPVVIAEWSAGSFGDKQLYLSALAMLVGAGASVLVTAVTTMFGNADSFKFTE